MQVISIQNIQDRPIIDAIAPQDFLLIGDASDGNQVKRVLISEFITDDNRADDDKLAIADYSFNTIAARSDSASHSFAAGSKELSGVLTRIRLTTGSTDVFDNGFIAPSFK